MIPELKTLLDKTKLWEAEEIEGVEVIEAACAFARSTSLRAELDQGVVKRVEAWETRLGNPEVVQVHPRTIMRYPNEDTARKAADLKALLSYYQSRKGR